ncbi:MAG: bifunctional [glutamate--ammonia ligase]-adenylyl-L-tyrosine phosphorylase/[glutamate--ammonia-ligase] adenylyltransferase [Desulfobacteraceae bacterium]|nr:MAG: bifunctional [glutamate--ammonia ligase]-adenylyl-L-tyrosine phosphorylase/[glutamate--ammonia-ligase] adenylyltransferase [Desulfobacteraceae bacterium]
MRLSAIPKELLPDLDNKLDSFFSAFKDTSIDLDKDIKKDKEFFSELKFVLALSDFIAKTCIRNPAIFTDLLKKGDLKKSYPDGMYAKKVKRLLSGVKNEDAMGSILRKYRSREMIRIAWRDLSGIADLSETGRDLSGFADACIDAAVSHIYRIMKHEFGAPENTAGRAQKPVVIGMGKLGAFELNFSSDVDLIFAYPESGETKGGKTIIDNEEFFVRLCRRLINVIGATDYDGMVFRVDLRLRPYGESGPLVMSFDRMEDYYQEQGREWERYALIKARIVAGDKVAGEKLLERLKPFVYRRYLDYGAIESLRDMKEKITLQVMRKEMQGNIKLGPGGIREIEFFAQIFQLIRGGVVPLLQERDVVKVLGTLAENNYVSKDTCDELKDAYIFLRTVENHLQEFYDHQTHSLPENPVSEASLAASMGFSSTKLFQAEIEKHREKVQSHFSRLLEAGGNGAGDKEDNSQKVLHDVWQSLNREEENKIILISAGFKKPEDVIGLLKNLRSDPSTRALSGSGRHKLDKLIPVFLREAGMSGDPVSVLNHLVDLLKAIERRTCYLSLLLESPVAVKHLVRLAVSSSWIISFLARHPVLLDELLDTRTLYVPPQKPDLEKEIERRLERINSTDLEYQIEELCIFKQVNTLRVAAADVTGGLPLMKVSDHLSYIAEVIIKKVLELSWEHLVQKHGRPQCFLDGEKYEKGFAVIAYGKLGGLELGYSSDIDLVFLHSGVEGRTAKGQRPVENSQFFARLGERVVHILTSYTRAGMIYEADMRLRPSGGSGLLVSHIDGYRDYMLNAAWTWEHQAIVRARPVCGDSALAGRFEQIRREALSRLRDREKLRDEVINMREKMRKEHLKPDPDLFDIKQDTGGIVDIEFLVQYLVLLKSNKHNELTKWTDNVRILQTLAETKIIDNYTAHFLKEAYLTYRLTAHRLSLQEKPAKVEASRFSNLREQVINIWDRLITKCP